MQHAAGRPSLARLLAALPDAEVVSDEGEPANPWRGYKRCLRDLPQEGHVCVLQDDTVVCRNFVPALQRVAAANPDTVVCLFLGGMPKRSVHLARQALLRGRAYAPLHRADFMPMVANLWPVHVARSFLAWAEANPQRLGHPDPRSDDAVGGRWMRFTEAKVVATCPSLVEHPDDVASTVGLRHAAGRDKGRVAAHYIGDKDPLVLNWGA